MISSKRNVDPETVPMLPIGVARFQTAYGERKRVQVFCGDDCVVEQFHRHDCDINRIVDRFTATGVIDHVAQAVPSFSDVSETLDFARAMDLVARAHDSFASLPADLRKRFGNDPREFVAFVDDPANADELLRMGLREAPKPPKGDGGTPPPSGGEGAAGAPSGAGAAT